MPPSSRAQRDILRDVRDVLAAEAAALTRLTRSVDPRFARAVETLRLCRGKVAVTGVGKSGLIAQKVAATLTSTGTPAYFLHAADALHGDLGTIQRQDLVLAFGKSGESEELNDLLPAIGRIGARLIAVTANPRSTLARAATVVLHVPVEREACPLNLAPTTSTTAMLAVGDALAVALMKRRGFRKDHFALNHPGGSLGRRLTLRVSDLMRRGAANPVIRADALMPALLSEVTRQHCGAISVVDGRGRLLGFVTDYDLRRAFAGRSDPMKARARDVMNPRPAVARPEELAADVSQRMAGPRPLNVLPVVDAGRRAVGILLGHDLRAAGL